jgi:hypothetical protein
MNTAIRLIAEPFQKGKKKPERTRHLGANETRSLKGMTIHATIFSAHCQGKSAQPINSRNLSHLLSPASRKTQELAISYAGSQAGRLQTFACPSQAVSQCQKKSENRIPHFARAIEAA